MRFLIFIISLSSFASFADSIQATFNLTAKVTASGGCTFDQKGPIVVGFGTVYYTTNGNTLKDVLPETILSSMTCVGDYAGQTQLQLTPSNTGVVNFQGNTLMQVIYDKSGAISPDLAIRLLVNDNPQDIDKAFNIDMKAQPQLKAELVQIGDGKSFISGEEFSGTATLTMTFL